MMNFLKKSPTMKFESFERYIKIKIAYEKCKVRHFLIYDDIKKESILLLDSRPTRKFLSTIFIRSYKSIKLFS